MSAPTAERAIFLTRCDGAALYYPQHLWGGRAIALDAIAAQGATLKRQINPVNRLRDHSEPCRYRGHQLGGVQTMNNRSKQQGETVKQCRQCEEWPDAYRDGFCSYRCEMDNVDGVEPETSRKWHRNIRGEPYDQP